MTEERDLSMKKEAILGVGALGHDAAIALVCAETGDILYAIAEERLHPGRRQVRFRTRHSNHGSRD
jgi:predicted NodU family carbamoyl transferase